MLYNPEDYVVDWRRVGAGYAVAVVAILSFFALDLVCCVLCPPIQV